MIIAALTYGRYAATLNRCEPFLMEVENFEFASTNALTATPQMVREIPTLNKQTIHSPPQKCPVVIEPSKTARAVGQGRSPVLIPNKLTTPNETGFSSEVCVLLP